MANINLAPGTQYAELVRKRRLRLFLLSGAIVGLMFVAWGGFLIIEKNLQSQQNEIDKKIIDTDKNISELGEEGKRALLFESRLLALSKLLDNHVSWNPFLTDIERLLPQPTVLKSITAKLDTGTVDISGETTDIDFVAQTMASLNNRTDRATLFSNGVFSSLAKVASANEGEPDKTSFSAVFFFDKDDFSNKQ